MNATATAIDWLIPLKFIREEIPLIVLPVSINESAPLRFILDTGNATAAFVLSRRVAEMLNLTIQSSADFPTPTGVGAEPIELLATEVASISVGPFHLGNTRVAVSKSMDQLSRAVGREIDGNIGYPFLQSLCVTIDYANRTFRLGPSGETASSIGIPFVLGSPKPLILLSVNAHGRAYRFAVDTGAGSTVVSTEMATELGLERGVAVPMHGAGGAATGFVTRLSTLQFGSVALHDLTVVAADIFQNLRVPVGGALDGIIGYNVMKDFCITIDYPQKQIWFERE
jgi:predicted aspartyl protease